MIKKQQRWIALFVALTFIWLMQISTMPMAAADNAEQASIAKTGQGPDYYEAVGHKSAPTKKKSILPWILIGVGVITITAVVLFLFVLKSYDITGTWAVTTIWNGSAATHFTLVFTGTKKTGTFKEGSYWTGTYTVDGKDATWRYDGEDMVFTGKFSGKDSIEGTMTDPPDSGTFTAVRMAAASGKENSGPGGKATEIK